MKSTYIVLGISCSALLIVLFFYPRPLFDSDSMRAQRHVIQKYGADAFSTPGTPCKYLTDGIGISWAPFGRTLTSCDNKYYVGFWGGVRKLNQASFPVTSSSTSNNIPENEKDVFHRDVHEYRLPTDTTSSTLQVHWLTEPKQAYIQEVLGRVVPEAVSNGMSRAVFLEHVGRSHVLWERGSIDGGPFDGSRLYYWQYIEKGDDFTSLVLISKDGTEARSLQKTVMVGFEYDKEFMIPAPNLHINWETPPEFFELHLGGKDALLAFSSVYADACLNAEDCEQAKKAKEEHRKNSTGYAPIVPNCGRRGCTSLVLPIAEQPSPLLNLGWIPGTKYSAYKAPGLINEGREENWQELPVPDTGEIYLIGEDGKKYTYFSLISTRDDGYDEINGPYREPQIQWNSSEEIFKRYSPILGFGGVDLLKKSEIRPSEWIVAGKTITNDPIYILKSSGDRPAFGHPHGFKPTPKEQAAYVEIKRAYPPGHFFWQDGLGRWVRYTREDLIEEEW